MLPVKYKQRLYRKIKQKSSGCTRLLIDGKREFRRFKTLPVVNTNWRKEIPAVDEDAHRVKFKYKELRIKKTCFRLFLDRRPQRLAQTSLLDFFSAQKRKRRM